MFYLSILVIDFFEWIIVDDGFRTFIVRFDGFVKCFRSISICPLLVFQLENVLIPQHCNFYDSVIHIELWPYQHRLLPWLRSISVFLGYFGSGFIVSNVIWLSCPCYFHRL